MNKDDKNTEETTVQGAKSFTLLYIAIGCFAAACILFALAFFIHGAGVYMLIASLTCSLAAVSFINGQKRKATNMLCKVLQILSYVVMFAALAVFVIGAGFGASAK
ncbi:MAG: hypothetical protein K2K04_06755 [Clostridia bacterium]|nr:hypothetical protein [Clostridia bacterium]